MGTAPAGEPFTQKYTGTLGPSMRAVVPVLDGRRQRSSPWCRSASPSQRDPGRARGPAADHRAGGRALVLGTGLLGAWLISRRLRRQTHGLGEREITRMYEYYDAVLHAVREGLLLRRHGRAGCSCSTTRPSGCWTCDGDRGRAARRRTRAAGVA